MTTIPEIMRNAQLWVAKRTTQEAKEPKETVSCPACRYAKWEPLPHFCGLVCFMAEGDAGLSNNFITGAPKGTKGAATGAVAYVCIHSGFIRFHHFRDSLWAQEDSKDAIKETG